MPLRHVPAHPQGDSSRVDAEETMMRTTRRDFLRITSIGTTALVLGVNRVSGDPVETWKPNPWLRIDPDGTVTIIVGKQEMGQGVRTSIPRIVADELDADWTKIRIEQASTGPEYTNLNTGGSGSIYRAWRTLRPIAATAREMLILAAAARWSVDRESLRTENGAVLHDASGRRAHYGELTGAAAKIKAPENVTPKKLGTHRIVGRSMKRIDGPAIVRGKAKYGLDTRVEGMRVATVLRPPAVSGRVVSFDGTAAKKIRGVRDVIAISTGVAIVADSTWPAFKARELVKVQWDDGPNHNFDSKKYIDQLTARSEEHTSEL